MQAQTKKKKKIKRSLVESLQHNARRDRIRRMLNDFYGRTRYLFFSLHRRTRRSKKQHHFGCLVGVTKNGLLFVLAQGRREQEQEKKNEITLTFYIISWLIGRFTSIGKMVHHTLEKESIHLPWVSCHRARSVKHSLCFLLRLNTALLLLYPL